MHNVYIDWLFLFLKDCLPTIAFVLFVVAIIYINYTGELDE